MYISTDEQDKLVLKHISFHWVGPVALALLLSHYAALSGSRVILQCTWYEEKLAICEGMIISGLFAFLNTCIFEYRPGEHQYMSLIWCI